MSNQISKHRLKFRSVSCLPLFLLLLIVGATLWQQHSKVTMLRQIAGTIQPGEDMRQVDIRLGKSKLFYETGVPSPGAPPTELGAMYGGDVNAIRQELDGVVSRLLRGYPRWYPSQHFRSWPVVIECDHDYRVTAVYVDGVRIQPR